MCHLAAGEISCPTPLAVTWQAITRVNTKRSAQRQLTLTAWVYWRILGKCGRVQMFQNDGHKSKAHSERTRQTDNFRTSLPPFCSAASVIQVSHLLRSKYTGIVNGMLFDIGIRIDPSILNLSQLNPFLTQSTPFNIIRVPCRNMILQYLFEKLHDEKICTAIQKTFYMFRLF